MGEIHEGVQQVQALLSEMGYGHTVVWLPDSARTAKEAADAIGCEVAEIAKSIIFRLKKSGQPLLVVASGTNRVNEKEIARYVQDELGKADADFVRERTGFVIGGVAPIGHSENMITIIDQDLLKFRTVWAAAGHPKAVFQLTPGELVAITKGQVMSIQ
ncbi:MULTISPECIES: YbaK/EbsC family protein [Paenibacillus]|uniref:Cys-tRNA(Pro)/cys-tRNA(Cys) deacylase n=1 Tax=Paenibacillus albilobatus TaxID=2716884 RepID=A0A919XHR8_9BACL|nr:MULTISPECIES: YbaK/EbsC family protein [Paenibacillus]GIO32431.1 cys-tRNA(pro)/cys-tRNA(cys) deacylase [Paenibacillus albilobatus]